MGVESEMRAEITDLKRQVKQLSAELMEKDGVISTLKEQLRHHEEFSTRSDNLQEQLNKYLRARMVERAELEEQLRSGQSSPSHSSRGGDSAASEAPSEFGKTQVRDVVDQIQRWLFLEGGNLRDVESLITEYSNFMRSIGIPLDRVFIAGMMLHPKVSAYVWKWEVGQDFNEHEVPHAAFQKPNYNPDEPFAVLMEGRAMEYRMTAAQNEIPPGCAWFTRDGYQDYFALPYYHRGEFKGAMAWCTKSETGWNDEHVTVFERSLAALSTVLRLHTNDIVTKTLTSRLEEEVQAQTKEIAAANANLEKANEKILRQSQAQLRHFAMMSHEIRTPLNCIVGLSNLLMDSNIDASMKESIEMITSSGDLLLAVVDDVLDYSKLAAGKVETLIAPCKLQVAMGAVVSAVRIKAKGMGVDLRTTISQDLPATINTDSRRLQQILYNLLGNAIKFGREGKVVDFTVGVRSNDMVHFSVKDYGKGIAPNDINKIFEPFQQASTNNPGHGGTGLGLAIARQLVRTLGGNITVHSEYGRWCDFQVELPVDYSGAVGGHEPESLTASDVIHHVPLDLHAILQDSSDREDDASQYSASYSSSLHNSEEMNVTESLQESHAGMSTVPDESISTAATGEAAPLSPMPPVGKKLKKSIHSPKRVSPKRQASSVDFFGNLRVLIAEDNAINQKVLQRSLNRLGIEHIDIVDDGQKAVDASASHVYHVIFMDLQMPVMDGLEATRIISKRPERPKIVFLTAHALQEFQHQAAEAGGDGFVSKPFKLDEIRGLLRKFRQQQQQQRHLRASTGKLPQVSI